MKTINVKPVQVVGSCPASLTRDDAFRIDGMRVDNPRGSAICFLALGQMAIGQGVWQLQSEERFFSHVSCPGCTREPGKENRVVFLLGHTDKWKLCLAISESLRFGKQHEETEAARRHKEAAMQYQSQGRYSEAAQEMELALQALRQAIGEQRAGGSR